jgi:hypothetical protein
VGIVENSARHDGELRLALDTAQNGFPATYAGDLFLSALRADWTIGPAQCFQVLPALAFAVETRHKIREVDSLKDRRNSRHGHAPMKQKKGKRQKSDRQVLKRIFPQEIVREVDATLEDLDGPKRLPNPLPNPPKRPLKPWGRKWAEEKKSE